MQDQQTSRSVYRVRVGHTEVTVKATSADEAITLARLQLSQDLPRFYDIIQTLEPTRFDVREAA